ncbi:hypothetical protein K4R64_01240 [Staphylococcus epidermidis]|nr:hypothetical protein [Staphylococcus epidermidis]
MKLIYEYFVVDETGKICIKYENLNYVIIDTDNIKHKPKSVGNSQRNKNFVVIFTNKFK